MDLQSSSRPAETGELAKGTARYGLIRLIRRRQSASRPQDRPSTLRVVGLCPVTRRGSCDRGPSRPCAWIAGNPDARKGASMPVGVRRRAIEFQLIVEKPAGSEMDMGQSFVIAKTFGDGLGLLQSAK